MTIHIGYTGTQRGMTDAQCERVWELVRFKDFFAHHGDCVGGDAQFDAIVRRAPWCRGVIVHPPINPSKRAYVTIRPQDILLEEKEYLDRNRDIAESVVFDPTRDPSLPDRVRASWTGFLIVGPGEDQEQFRSGTWSTYRHAKKLGIPYSLILPNGAVFHDTHFVGNANLQE